MLFRWDAGVDVVTPELALVHGPFALQAEYAHSFVDPSVGRNVDFSGYYVQASYFLNGEHRQYQTTTGGFSRIRPTRNFGSDGGWGALEVAVRYSHVDLQDGVILGGKLDDVTAGVNWYLTPNMRLMANYVHADLSSVGKTNIIQLRAQVDF